MRLGSDAGVEFWIRDRDTKFPAFDAVFTAIGARIGALAPGSAIAERWISSARRECTDRLLITGRRHLKAVLAEYVEHYNTHRPHRSRQQHPPHPGSHPMPAGGDLRVLRHDRPGDLIHE